MRHHSKRTVDNDNHYPMTRLPNIWAIYEVGNKFLIQIPGKTEGIWKEYLTKAINLI